MAKKTVHIARCAITGRIVMPAFEVSQPKTTVVETRPAPKRASMK